MHPAHSNRPEHWSIKRRMTLIEEGSLMKFRLNESAVGVHPSSWKHPSPAVHSGCGGQWDFLFVSPPWLWFASVENPDKLFCHRTVTRFMKSAFQMREQMICSKTQWATWANAKAVPNHKHALENTSFGLESSGYRNPRIHCDKLVNYLFYFILKSIWHKLVCF